MTEKYQMAASNQNQNHENLGIQRVYPDYPLKTEDMTKEEHQEAVKKFFTSKVGVDACGIS